MGHYDDFDVLMSDNPDGTNSVWDGHEMRLSHAKPASTIVIAHEGPTDADVHQTYVDAITDETRIVPDPAKPGFLKTLAELAIERNAYQPAEVPVANNAQELILGGALTGDELRPWHGGTV